MAEKFSSFRNGDCVCMVCGWNLTGHDGLKCIQVFSEDGVDALREKNIASLDGQRSKAGSPRSAFAGRRRIS